jgi:hypothetical protein
MDMDQAAVFLAGSILTALGFLVVIAAVVVVNNVLHKYWKPVRMFTADSWNFNPPTRYLTDEEAARIAPTLNTTEQVKDTRPASGV